MGEAMADAMADYLRNVIYSMGTNLASGRITKTVDLQQNAPPPRYSAIADNATPSGSSRSQESSPSTNAVVETNEKQITHHRRFKTDVSQKRTKIFQRHLTSSYSDDSDEPSPMNDCNAVVASTSNDSPKRTKSAPSKESDKDVESYSYERPNTVEKTHEEQKKENKKKRHKGKKDTPPQPRTAFNERTSESKEETTKKKERNIKQKRKERRKLEKPENNEEYGPDDTADEKMKGPSTEDNETMKKIRELEKKVNDNLDDILGNDWKEIPPDLNEDQMNELLKNL